MCCVIKIDFLLNFVVVYNLTKIVKSKLKRDATLFLQINL